jgi:TPR repeat protein
MYKYNMKYLLIVFLMVINFSLAENLEELKEQANLGDKFAQYQLGVMYADGEKVPQDYAESVRWLQLSIQSDEGDYISDAILRLGIAYYKGEGIDQNYTTALNYFGAVGYYKNNAEAQRLLGQMYLQGIGVKKNYSEAKVWLKKACDNNDTIACNEYYHYQLDDK